MSSVLERKKGRLIELPEREKTVSLIQQTIAAGARQEPACEILGISCRTYQRWMKDKEIQADKRLNNIPACRNALTKEDKKAMIDILNQPEYSYLTPYQIVPLLLDKGQYIASESSFYRVMREHNLLKHRAKSAPKKHKKPTPLVATKPNEVYSWDITYLPTPIKGKYLYLYLVEDIYSRKIVGQQVYDCESSAYAADLIEDIAQREKINKNQLTLHSDNGSPMKGATLKAKMADLIIASSYSRPRVSNDNPYSESLFRTLKYHYSYPEKPFEDLLSARQWVTGFVDWYNNEHQHSAIKYVTPVQRHLGEDVAILAKRKAVIEQAKVEKPSRWNSRDTRNLIPVKKVYLNPETESEAA